MPITQDRMYSLITACQEYRESIANCAKAADRAQHNMGQVESNVILRDLIMAIQQCYLTISSDSKAALQIEIDRYKRTNKRNERLKAKREAKRGYEKPEHQDSDSAEVTEEEMIQYIRWKLSQNEALTEDEAELWAKKKGPYGPFSHS